MILALISNHQQNKKVSLEEIDFDNVAPPTLQGVEIPSAAPMLALSTIFTWN